jgi:hypothetical protein
MQSLSVLTAQGTTWGGVQIKRDTWYPQARNCECCKGFIFGCKTEACEKRGECMCSGTPAPAAEGEAKSNKPTEGGKEEGAVAELAEKAADLKVSEGAE